MKNQKTKTGNATAVIEVTTSMGDSYNDKWSQTKEKKDSSQTLAAYKVAITAAKYQHQYLHARGSKKKIAFFE